MNSPKPMQKTNGQCFDSDFAAIAGMEADVADFMKEDGNSMPHPIPTFTKRHRRHQSRLSEEFTPFVDDLLDDLPFCPKSKPMVQDLTPFQARTSTPYVMNPAMQLFNTKSKAFHQEIIASMSKVSLDKTRDSGRWSLDTQDVEELRNLSPTPLPRLSLEKSFDEAVDVTVDSAYGSEWFTRDSEHAEIESVLEKSIKESPSIVEVGPEIRHEETRVSLPETPNDVVKRVLRQFTPVEPDRLIGRRMGRDHVDIISKLSLRNMSSVLSLVFEHVEDKDLSCMMSVSKSWKAACENDKHVKKRLACASEKSRLWKVELQKENITLRRSPRKKRAVTQGTTLGEVQLLGDEVSIPKVVTRQSVQLLWEGEAAKLRTDEELRKCPLCQSPARTLPAQDRACCTQCQHDFCTRCHCQFHGARSCEMAVTLRKKQKSENTVGSRKSKKNLRRL